MNQTALNLAPVSGALGVKVEGVRIGDSLDDGVIAKIVDALRTNALLVFQGQELTPRGIVAFLDRFSNTFPHWNLSPQIISDSEGKVMRISSSDSKGAGSTWHSDYSYLEQPAKYTAFFMREIPRVGGNTGFANLYTAYEALSESMKTLLSDKSAVHDNSHRHYRQYAEGDTYLSKDDYASFPPVIHPLVREHPATGRKALFFGEADTVSIVGLPYLESQAIIGFLTNHCAQMEFLYRHVWAPGDLVLWDNRCVNHCAIQDYDLNEPREGMIACAHDRLST